MIPIQLTISGFLSYRDPIELDFTVFDLACIAGPNGAGKSSLLDAITWVLFGQGRKRDESLINTQCETAQVTFTFLYEGNTYRVQRTNTRGKSTLLEFHIQTTDGSWKPLTERTLRETDARIQEVLRMDYETFVNAAFFLQGKADQFTQQRPGDRKRILSSILGLEVWESYRQRAAERRRSVQAEIDNLNGRLQEIEAELAEEATRRDHLQQLENELERSSKARAAQETGLETIRQVAATLAEQTKLVEALARQLETSIQALGELERRLEARQEERQSYTQTLSQAQEIEAAYQAWDQARAQLTRWEEIATNFREHEKRRVTPLTEIESARARLEAEMQSLQAQNETIQQAQSEIPDLKARSEAAQAVLETSQEQLAQRAKLQEDLQGAQQSRMEAQAENPRLREAMNELKGRIDQLTQTEGASCPLCGQTLSPKDRENLIAQLTIEGKDMGDRFRANKALLEEHVQRVTYLETQIAELAQAESVTRDQLREVDQLSAQLEAIRQQVDDWQAIGAPRHADIGRALSTEDYAQDARAFLAQIDAELKEIGYDASLHDAVRRAESEGRASEEQMRALEKARAAAAPLEREIGELEAQIKGQRREINRQRSEHETAAAALAAAEAQAPDLESAEKELLQLQQEENQLRMEIGAAQQKVLVLEGLKDRRQSLQTEREQLNHRVGQYQQLERAFSKDGIPALLIEQALPQIEAKTNDILDRLSGGSMAVRFVTQAAYKDKRRSDLRETLDIQISDSAGIRDYEMYSGGEAFRVNFAIRLALSEVLAQRAGARLQTLVIDEGFGSQDTIGRQRLIEAINMVRPDFAKILVITHIEELKDTFPTRIEVEKTERGSVIHMSPHGL